MKVGNCRKFLVFLGCWDGRRGKKAYNSTNMKSRKDLSYLEKNNKFEVKKGGESEGETE